MIADITITEKSFGPKMLMHNVRFSVDAKEKVGIIGRNGVGKSTLFGILAGHDNDFTGDIIYKRSTTVVATAQEHHGFEQKTVLQYILAGLPEYPELSHTITTYPESMGSDMHKINQYTEALQRFTDKGFYQIEEQIERELDNFQLPPGAAHRLLATLSGGQKRLVEVVKIMHAQADLALIDEPTNHMDYVAKNQFITWLQTAPEAMLIITHDRDVLNEVDRIIELKDGTAHSFKGNYIAYLKQNAVSTGTAMTEYELIGRRITNLKAKVIQFRRLKEKARDPDTIKQFKRRENEAQQELEELEKIKKPTFWIDKTSAQNLDYKAANRYDTFKARNIKMNLNGSESRSKHVLISVKDLSLGYGETPLFSDVTFTVREGEALELRGRNGAGKTTLIKALLAQASLATSTSKYLQPEHKATSGPEFMPGAKPFASAGSKRGPGELIKHFAGEITLDKHMRLGLYEQEVSPRYFDLPLQEAIERLYLDRSLPITATKIRKLLNDYLFTEADSNVPLARLSGGQKARFQLIAMLANDPQLLILDEPTNHLDLPSIEELETALSRYTGAILYVSHDGYFRSALDGEYVEIGKT